MVSISRLFMVCVLLTVLVACAKPGEPQVFRGDIFGTFFEISIGAEHTDFDRDGIEAGILATLDEVDRQMSTYRDDSVLNELNWAPLDTPVIVEPELFYVLERSEVIATQSGGSFDHTVGGLVNLWGFGRDGRVTQRPDEATLQEKLDKVGYHFVILDPDNQTVMRTSDVFIELSAIAKGYGVDAVSNYLHEQGLTNHLVNIGGDIIAYGQRNSEQHWRVGIEAPVDGRQVLQHILPIKDVAMVSSGDYRNYFEQDGVRYSHTIDPTTGEPIAHRLAAVTVMADNATDADGYATALMVMGAERGRAFADQHDLAALFVVRSDSGYESVMSARFQRDYADDMRVPRVQ